MLERGGNDGDQRKSAAGVLFFCLMSVTRPRALRTQLAAYVADHDDLVATQANPCTEPEDRPVGGWKCGCEMCKASRPLVDVHGSMKRLAEAFLDVTHLRNLLLLALGFITRRTITDDDVAWAEKTRSDLHRGS